jgi:hypothetical protein
MTTLCDVCVKPKEPDITGELRCRQCDDAIDSMVRHDWEDAVAAGQVEVWWHEPPAPESAAEAIGDAWDELWG